MLRQQRYDIIIDWFEKNLPAPETELLYSDPFSLLVAVVLSAQCTDKRVNMVTPALMEAYPNPETMAAATSDEIFKYIRSISYPNNKAKHLVGLAQMLVNEYQSKVPDTVQELTRLPGVGRKTANVIVSVIYNQPAMAVDTHVFRVSKRIGLVNANLSTPLKVEEGLMRYLPKEIVPKAHHWLILHGRYTCLARTPKCTECGISMACKYFEKANKKINAESA